MDVMQLRRRLMMSGSAIHNINVWDEQWEMGRLDTMTGASTNSSSTTQIRTSGYIKLTPNTKYYFYSSGKGSQWSMFYDADKVVIPVSEYPISEMPNRSRNAYGNRNVEFTTPPNCHYMRFYCTEAYGNTYSHNISVNYPSTDHEYHPHID